MQGILAELSLGTFEMEYMLLMLLLLPLLFGDLFGAGDAGVPAIDGTPEDDEVTGTAQGEEINTFAGDDVVLAGAGDDNVNLGDGDDGGAGEDGNDLIFGGAGNDIADGGSGNDTIWLGDGDDAINYYTPEELGQDPSIDLSMAGDDRISGGGGADYLYDWVGSDTLTGELGRDYIDTVDNAGTAQAADMNSGGWGGDTLWADDGDTMSGGGNSDDFNVWIDETSDEAVTITDFDGATETLDLDFDQATFDGLTVDDVTLSTDPDTGDVSIMALDQVVAVLTNATNVDVLNVGLPEWMFPPAA